MPTEDVKPAPAKFGPRLTLIGLLFIFVSPILIAWAYTAGYINLPVPERTNRGTFVVPPLDLRNESATQALFDRAKLQPGEWILAYIAAGSCGESCLAALDELKTVRSLLGYSGQRVRVLAITASAQAHDETHIMADPTVASALTSLLNERTGTSVDAQIVLMDWRKQLVIRFDQAVAPDDINKDLKKLLRASQIR
jgi:hypothetical protein